MLVAVVATGVPLALYKVTVALATACASSFKPLPLLSTKAVPDKVAGSMAPPSTCATSPDVKPVTGKLPVAGLISLSALCGM